MPGPGIFKTFLSILKVLDTGMEHTYTASMVTALRKKKIGTQIDPLLHRKLKLLSAATGRRIDAIVEDALRAALAAFPTEEFITFEEMHARYEKLHGVKIDVAAEAARLAHRPRK
jgi:hypothetical protein